MPFVANELKGKIDLERLPGEQKMKQKIQDEIKIAMKSGDKERLGTLRMLLSGIKDFEVNTRKTPTDADIIGIFRKAIKQRKDSVEAFKQGGRTDLVAQEEKEIALIESFLPADISDEELTKIVDEVIASTGASSMKEMGNVMKLVLEKAAGRTDGSRVNPIVKERLSGAPKK